MGCSPPGSSVHEILQERILKWVAMPSSRGSSLGQYTSPINAHLKFFFLMLRTFKIYSQQLLEKEMTTHFSILSWRIPWTEKTGGLQPMGFQSVTAQRPNSNSHRKMDTTCQGEILLCSMSSQDFYLKTLIVQGNLWSNSDVIDDQEGISQSGSLNDDEIFDR